MINSLRKGLPGLAFRWLNAEFSRARIAPLMASMARAASVQSDSSLLLIRPAEV